MRLARFIFYFICVVQITKHYARDRSRAVQGFSALTDKLLLAFGLQESGTALVEAEEQKQPHVNITEQRASPLPRGVEQHNQQVQELPKEAVAYVYPPRLGQPLGPSLSFPPHVSSATQQQPFQQARLVQQAQVMQQMMHQSHLLEMEISRLQQSLGLHSLGPQAAPMTFDMLVQQQQQQFLQALAAMQQQQQHR